MAERIKGLQIDLSMRDMGVSKTLAAIKREFRALNSSLKLSSNNFKYGEKSASSYKERMNDLDKAIKVGTSNLDQLEKKYKEVAQSQGANSAKAVRLQTEYNKQANAINAMQDEYSRLNKYYKENFSMAGRLSNSFKKIGSSMQGVGQKAQDVGSSLSSKITKPALAAGTAMAGITAKLGFDRLVGLDSAKAKLEGLGYSTKEVGSITDQVAKAIEGGMTTMAEGTDIAAGALAAGVKEGKDLQHYIKLVGDAAVGANRPVGDMAMIFNRVQGQGKLMTEELNMIEEGMPGFAMAMSKHLGVSQEEFRKMVTEGKVTSEDFMTVMDDFAGGMAKSYAKSWKGMVQNSKAYIGQIGEAFLSSTFQKAKGGLHEFEKMLKSPGAKQWASETGEKLGNTLESIGNGIKGLINWWQSLDGSTQKTLGGIVKWLGITLVTMGPVLTIFGKMASTIGGMFSGIFGLIKFFIKHNAAAKISAASQAVWNGVTATARGIANGYRYAMAALSTSQTIQAIKSKIAAAAMTVWTGVTKAATLATKGLGLAIRFMTGPIGITITAITILVGTITYLWKTNSTFRNAVIGIWNSIKNAAIAIFGFLKNYIVGIWTAVKVSTLIIWNAIKGNAAIIWDAIKLAIQRPIQVLKAVLSVLWNGMKNTAIKIWALLKNGVIAIIKAYVAQIRANFNLVKRIVLTIFNAIKSFSIKVWNAIKNGILNIVRGLRNGIANIFKGIKNTVTTIFNAVKNFSIKVWNAIKNGVINRAKGLWNGVKAAFNALKKGTTAIFNAVKNFVLKVWTNIKNSVVNRAKALWSGVKNAWNSLKNGTTKTFKAVGSFMSSKWSSIKSGTVNKAKALWSGVNGAWGSLSKGTHKTMNAIGGFMSKKWKGIKSGTINLVTTMKNKVTGVMNKMGDVIKSVTGKIKGFFSGMIKGVKKGLNTLIKGVNWVGDKLGMKKLPEVKLHTGTESTHTQSFVTNGKINRDTFATVGDKGRGNGPNGFRHEMIRYPNGKMALTPNRDTTAFLPKGSSVMNGAQTHSMLNNLPKFSTGTNKKKKEWNFAQEALEGANAIKKDVTDKIVSGGKTVVNKSLNMASKGKKWLEDTVGDVMDWIEKPGKLLDKVLESVGLDLSGFGIPESASLPYDMMKGMFKKLKKAAIDTIKGWMEEQEGGDGDAAWLLKHPVLQRFGHYTGGLMFNGGRHYGIDFGMPTGTKIRALTDGIITQSGWASGGGGNQITLKEPGGKYFQWYMHMSKLLAKQGDKVKTGDVIGLSGSTGNSTTPHLHIQRMKGRVGNDTALSNVMDWLKGLGGGKSGKWNGDIKKALKIAGLPTSKAYVNAWAKQIQTESGGNPKALGGTDGLADGRAKGLVQVKPGTFNAYKAKGHGNIWNGLDNLIAGMRYAKATYGKGGMLGVIGKGHGYATGGLIKSSGLYNLAEGGYPEWVIPTDPSRNSDAMKLLALAAQDIDSKNKRNKRPNQMRTPSTSNNSNDNTELLLQMIANQQRQLDALMQIARSNKNIEQQPKGFNEREVSKAQGKRAEMMAYNLGGAF